MNINQFTLWDITVNVVPGILTVLLIVLLFPLSIFNQFIDFATESGVLAVSIFLVVSYVVGRAFQEGISRKVDSYISELSDSDTYQSSVLYFIDEMNMARDDNQPRVRKIFLEEAQVKFASKDAESIDEVNQRLDDFDIFKLSQEYVIGNDLGRANRFMILSRFHRSIYVLSLFGVFGHIFVQVAWPILGYEIVLTQLQSAILILSLIVIGAVSFKERWFFEYKFVDSLIYGFCADTRES
ncbi:hypothetical protein [Natrinema salinisoli]|uniref:hypothetical protein n=1 Tax=Natrinema salinisoli TaxID=2878535 RepID=UPI001CF04DBC|nr:hypothetical protein [Natrinema salinisoli]